MVRLATIEHNGCRKLVAQKITNNNEEYEYCDLTPVCQSVVDYFASPERVQQFLPSAPKIPAKECRRLLAPMDGSQECGKFICIGMNYKDHCTEQNVPIPKEPLIFNKFGDCIIGPNEPIAIEGMTEQLDYEVELGVVIGSKVPRFCKEADAEKYIGGFTVIHDVSARDWQLGDPHRNGGQWILGKAMSGYAPMGPVIVTTDELTLDQAQNARIACRVNGETLQDSYTSQLIHSIPKIIEYISQFVTLRPGDVIATGTPPGVGCFRTPPRWLVPGDVVECEIEGIGVISNPIVEHIAEETIPPPLPSAGSLSGMTCVVTGGAQGIGFGISQRLSREGASRVVLVDIQEESVMQQACEELQKNCSQQNHCQYSFEICNVTEYAAVAECWKRIAANNNHRIDVLIQAAGIVGDTNIKTQDVSPENFQKVLNVNLSGIFHGCKAVLPYMTHQRYGRIVNIASIAGKEGNAGMLAYSTSKAAVIGLTKTIGKEYATHSNIVCNALCPAVVRTEMVKNMPEEQVTYMTDKIPMKRCGTIDEIAAMVAFMVSPETSFTTGFCFDATGGRSVY